MWKLVLFHLEIVLILVQDRCTGCGEYTMGMEIVLGVPDGTVGDVGQVEAYFSPFGDSVILTQDRCTVCSERTIGLEIILDTCNVTPR